MDLGAVSRAARNESAKRLPSLLVSEQIGKSTFAGNFSDFAVYRDLTSLIVACGAGGDN